MTEHGRFIVNISASAAWRLRPVGIIRVERELVKQLSRLEGERIVPVVLEPGGGRFRHVSNTDFARVLDDAWVASKAPHQERGLDLSRSEWLQATHGDRFVSLGSDWSFGVPALVRQLYGEQRVLITACYDLIPLLYPEYTPDPDFERQFLRHYTDVANQGRGVMAISEHSKSDLMKFWRGNNLFDRAPPVEVIPLAGFDTSSSASPLNPGDAKLLQQIESDGEYVVFVSTIEPRKNHQLLLDIWREMYQERRARCPQLLLIGMRGWGSNDLLTMVSRMAAAKAQRVKWLEGVSDALLAHLYKKAAFAVFPSVYEGWGLAATEAMAYGKVCLVSSSSSLQEATQHLMPALDPRDYAAWRREIARLIDDAPHRRRLETNIKNRWQPRYWNDVGEEFRNRLLLA